MNFRLLALCACVQTLEKVDAIACGRPPGDTGHLFDALFTQNAKTFVEVFPDPQQYETGVEATIHALSGEVKSAQLIRYLLSVIDLTSRLKASTRTVAQLGMSLDRVAADRPVTQIEFRLAYIYQDTLSKLGKRIQVVGDPTALQQARTAANIRSLLLAAVRFAWLWDQLGGRRWQLILRRRSLLLALQHFRQTLRPTHES